MMSPNKGKWTAGADPEMMLQKGGRYVAVQPYINGTKEKPFPLPSGGNAQRDNVAIEFGVKISPTKRDFVFNIGTTIHELIDILPMDVSLHVVPSALFPGKELKHTECKKFGCEGDYCAWTGEPNPAPNRRGYKRLRSCGGHAHIGHVPGSGYSFLLEDEGKMLVIQALDCTIGFISTVLDNSFPAIERRKLYGKAGCYRPTDYGVEYRTLSNFWIKSPHLVELVYHVIDDTLKVVKGYDALDLIDRIGKDEVQRVINTGDAEAAVEHIDRTITNYLGFESLSLYQKCLEEIGTYQFLKEWENV
jgi:hypothetical protein